MIFKKLIALLLIVCPLSGTSFAAECDPYSDKDVSGKTPEALMAQFMEGNGLDERSFSLCYSNAVTGEQAAKEEAERIAGEQAAEQTAQKQQNAFEWWMIAVALGVFLLGGGGLLLSGRRKGHLHDMLKDTEQDDHV